jgi:hypothetical protein
MFLLSQNVERVPEPREWLATPISNINPVWDGTQGPATFFRFRNVLHSFHNTQRNYDHHYLYIFRRFLVVAFWLIFNTKLNNQ